MVNNKHLILGIHVTNRSKNAKDIQNTLTEFGCNIKTRLGLHEVDENHCATSGIILVELTGKKEDTDKLITKLNSIAGIDIQQMEFSH